MLRLTLIIAFHGGKLIVADKKTGSEWLHGALNKVFATNSVCRRQVDILNVPSKEQHAGI